jgi:DNA-binding NarL/FixJ family response regulator
LDIMLPEVDGWDVLMQIKGDADSATSTIPVVVLTARSDTLDRIRGEIEGAIRYLTKPFSPSELRNEVAQALAGDPEPIRRRHVQQGALSELARLERGDAGDTPEGDRSAHPRLTRLEPARSARHATGKAAAAPTPSKLQALSPKQHELLLAVASTLTVSEAADQLSVSRSNVYASLRRIARKLGVRTVTDLVHLARTGELG